MELGVGAHLSSVSYGAVTGAPGTNTTILTLITNLRYLSGTVHN
jgi:hypothetical protein